MMTKLIKRNLVKRSQYLFSQELLIQKQKIAKLQNRSLLILQGPEAYKLLQGLTTNDINILQTKNKKSQQSSSQQHRIQFFIKKVTTDRLSIYTLFLNPKGKVITDAFIYKPKAFQKGKKSFVQNQLWVDVNSKTKSSLLFHIQKHMWKKKVQIIDVDKQIDQFKPSVYIGFGHISTLSSIYDQGYEIEIPKNQYREQQYSNLMMFDPRGSNFGRRIINMQEQIGLSTKQFEYVNEKDYEQYERALGFVQSNLTYNKLPFQFNYDLMNSVSFKKGCYLGQQIISRSYYTGIVRKRVFPFQVLSNVSDAKQKIEQGTKLLDKEGKEIGKVIFYKEGEIGLALVSYLNYFNQNELPQNQMFSIEIQNPFQGLVFCPFKKQLKNYLIETKQKQTKLEELDI